MKFLYAAREKYDYTQDGNTARLARRSGEALEVRVSVARIAPSLLDLGHAVGMGMVLPFLTNPKDVLYASDGERDKAGWPSDIAPVEHTPVSPIQQGEPGSIPGQVTGFSHVGIVPDDAIGRGVFSGISCLPHPFIPALLHTDFNCPGLDLRTENRVTEQKNTIKVSAVRLSVRHDKYLMCGCQPLLGCGGQCNGPPTHHNTNKSNRTPWRYLTRCAATLAEWQRLTNSFQSAVSAWERATRLEQPSASSFNKLAVTSGEILNIEVLRAKEGGARSPRKPIDLGHRPVRFASRYEVVDLARECQSTRELSSLSHFEQHLASARTTGRITNDKVDRI
ncbi:hypothetical protein PR048_025691 [Dryococelus australis]|uniref:Uncharacterized protein n=1 Tax=Dryococelus australis TaxID=614101 RepID=A0ABQ9GJ94_9NEOP|nr:hypothetical protein PR048_025691 [Dryococelus australis]